MLPENLKVLLEISQDKLTIEHTNAQTRTESHRLHHVRLGYQDERWLEPHPTLLMLQVSPQPSSSSKCSAEKAFMEGEDDTHELQDERRSCCRHPEKLQNDG